jgi:hypothetical protein
MKQVTISDCFSTVKVKATWSSETSADYERATPLVGTDSRTLQSTRFTKAFSFNCLRMFPGYRYGGDGGDGGCVEF